MSAGKNVWQEALSDVITDPKELLTLLDLNPDLVKDTVAASNTFSLKVSRSFVARMQKGNLADPLLRQILPLATELNHVPGYKKDPLHELRANPVSGLLHKYPSRVLVTLTNACGIHCRYCFRRHFPYEENNPGRTGWADMFAYIQKDPLLSEVILSGGDPLVVSDKLLKQFTDQLCRIPHIKRLRIHTRLPVVIPERITDDLIALLAGLSILPVIVIHMNHPNEMSDTVKQALLRLRKTNITLLNQSVLLKGVNDDAETLAQLSEVLFQAGVLPYYLHLLDKVQGAHHFDMDIDDARKLHATLNQKLSGYLVPRLVVEQPGELSKVLLSTALYTG